MEPEDNKRIKDWEAVLMIIVGVAADLISIVAVVGNILALIFGGGTLALWFMIRGVGLVSPKKTAVWSISLIAEAIPIISVVPGYTVGTLVLLAIVRAEDVTGISLPTPGTKTSGSRNPGKKIQRRTEMSTERRGEIARRARNIQRIRNEKEFGVSPRGRIPLRDVVHSPKEA